MTPSDRNVHATSSIEFSLEQGILLQQKIPNSAMRQEESGRVLGGGGGGKA